jgi:hypothetical protein
MFSTIENLRSYWSLDLVTTPVSSFLPESHLVSSYARLKSHQVTGNLTNSLEIYRDLFSIADAEILGLIWTKGTNTDVSSRWSQPAFPHRMSEIKRWHWELLQRDLGTFLDIGFSSINNTFPSRPN